MKHPNVFGAHDQETEDRQLEETPLKEGWIRQYTDHTGRFFVDFDPNIPLEPWEQELQDILAEEINKEIVAKLDRCPIRIASDLRISGLSPLVALGALFE